MQLRSRTHPASPLINIDTNRTPLYTASLVMSVAYTVVTPKDIKPSYDLTVITVCRNVLPALKRTTASVLGQKAVFPSVSIEHVIVDGASTDGTPEWLADMKESGKIEVFVSEPDCGIYDAMNKGINLASGRVLLFLNADDVLEQVDLKPCLEPILSGRARVTCAVTRQYDHTAVHLFRPEKDKIYFSTPMCHQAYLAEASLYRELGGYRAEMFRCGADADFMYRAVKQTGFPHIVDETITSMPLGGFSFDCFLHYCDEDILLIHENKEQIFEHCRKEQAYCDAIVALLLKHCMTLRRWQLTHDRDISACIRKLQELCRTVSEITTSGGAKRAMRYAAGPYLDTILKHKQCTLYQWFRIRRYRKCCNLGSNAPYAEYIGAADLSITSTLSFYIGKISSSLFHRASARK